MPAPKGNQFWKVRSTSGRKPTFQDAETLYNCCLEYFQYVDDDPLVSYKAVLGKDGPEQLEQLHKRPYTLNGLCIFLGISDDTWRTYRGREEFLGVTKEIDQIIYDQKFTGATAGLFNANIIARDLGLKEHTQNDTSTRVQFGDMSDDELRAKICEFIEVL
tara:strand:+ start:1059 stop:1541 length:483 start_codon:yes stop_codon:yes gene_type:complete